MRIGGLVAAAGASIRMGFSKALLSAGGKPVAMTLTQAMREAGVDPVVCTLPPPHVLSASDVTAVAKLRALLEASGTIVVDNQAWESALLGSVWSALDAAPALDALVMTPVDAPATGSALIRLLLDRFAAAPDCWVRPSSAGRPGHPLVLPRRLFGDVRRHEGPGGVRAVLQRHVGIEVPWDDARACASIDTPSDAEAFTPPLCRWTA